MEHFFHYSSPLGGISLFSDGEALTGLYFDGQRYFPDKLVPFSTEADLPVFRQTARWLDVYFSGKAPGFVPPISLHTTSFRRAVYDILLGIPFGETMTYGEIAKRIDVRMSAQAVGGAAGHNPVSLIIPCHRAVGAGGRLTGYAGGLERKAALLKLERSKK